jgi:hypothetical protein
MLINLFEELIEKSDQPLYGECQDLSDFSNRSWEKKRLRYGSLRVIVSKFSYSSESKGRSVQRREKL